MKKRTNLFFLFLLLFLACNSVENVSTEIEERNKDTLQYLFTGHTYQWRDPLRQVDHRLIRLDKSRFDGIWLGGDISSETLLRPSTLAHIDSLFDLGDPNTHFAMGNHDARHRNWDWLRECTGREIFYSSHHQGITVVVIATTLSPADCELLDDQFDMLMSVCDTISASSHLIVMQHHATWGELPGLVDPILYGHGDFREWNVNCESSKNTFENSIYPSLKLVQERGVQVLCLLGDTGAGDLRKGIEMRSEDGIYFLASGINNSGYLPDSTDFKNAPGDSLLIFEHIPSARSLVWDFHSLDSLLLD